MESDENENIIKKNFDKYKNRIFSFLYFFQFIFTLFFCILIVFQQFNQSSVYFIYFYIIFCVGLLFLIILLNVLPNILSLVMLFIYFAYSFFFIFLIMHFTYGISIQKLPIIITMVIMFLIILFTCFVLLGEICHLYKCLTIFFIINAFSIYFLLLYVQYYQYSSVVLTTPPPPPSYDVSGTLLYDLSYNEHKYDQYYLYYNIFNIFYDSSSNPYTNKPKINTTTNTYTTYAPQNTIVNYISYYKLYVFILCVFYSVIYLKEYIKEQNLPSFVTIFIYMVIFEMVVGMLMYVLNVNKTNNSLQTFLWMELIPVCVTLVISILATGSVLGKSIASGIATDVPNINTGLTFIILLLLSIISCCICVFVYCYNSINRLISTNTFILWLFSSLSCVIISFLSANRYYLLSLAFVLFLIAVIGVLLYFLNILSFTMLNIYYVIFFFLMVFIGGISFINKNKINPDMIYGPKLNKISYGSVFRGIMVILILLMVFSFSNISGSTIEKNFILFLVCFIPIILFYMFYSTSKKTHKQGFLGALVQIVKDIISFFSEFLYKLIIIIVVILIAGICMYNLVTNQMSSVVIYFLAFFFFLILYICYYFQDFLKGDYSSEKFIKKITLINLLVYFAGLFIYYLLLAISKMINKKVSGSTSTTSSSTTSSTTSSSNTLLYLILFVFIAFIYLQYRNHLSSSTNPYLNLIINVILYIPCLFVILIEYINKQISEKNNTYFTIIIIEIVLIILYISSIFLRTYYVNKNGTVLIRDPIELNIKTNLTLPSGYQTNPSKPFALSFWFFINSQGLTTNKYFNIINFQNKPQILYNAKLDSLIADISGNTWSNSSKSSNVPSYTIYEQGSTIDSSGSNILLKKHKTSIIYINEEIIMQKWNYLVVNYNGSTLDIFINGQLVKSANQIVPNVNSLTFYVGEENGINGGFCNFLFFDNYLSYDNIIGMYNSLKNSNPPLENVYWNKTEKKIEFSKLNKLKEEYKKNNF
jgi:hypothetical protein